MHHGPELAVLVVICFTLGIGAALSMVCERLKVPYTIAMLGAGLGTGLLLQAHFKNGEWRVTRAWTGGRADG